MYPKTATAISCPNIAFIKYWGNRDDRLRLPSNSSISMNLDGLSTQTYVTFDASLASDELILNNTPVQGPALARVSAFLDLVRQMAALRLYARWRAVIISPWARGLPPPPRPSPPWHCQPARRRIGMSEKICRAWRGAALAPRALNSWRLYGMAGR